MIEASKKPQPTPTTHHRHVLPVSLTCSTIPPLQIRIASPPRLLGRPGSMNLGLRYRPLADFRAQPFQARTAAAFPPSGRARQPRLIGCPCAEIPKTLVRRREARQSGTIHQVLRTSISRERLVPAASAALQIPTCPATCHRRSSHPTKALRLNGKGSPYPSLVSSGPGQDLESRRGSEV